MQDSTTITHAPRNNRVDDGVPCPECETDLWVQGCRLDLGAYRCLDCGCLFDS